MIAVISFLLWMVAPQAPPAQQGQGTGSRAPTRATISGTTLPSDSTQPLPYVTLKLTPVDDPSAVPVPQTGRGGANPNGNYQATSDAIGSFQFSGIAPGRYTISAERMGYLRQERFQTGPGRASESTLTVVAGQKIEGLIFALASVPAIAGFVYGVDGQGQAGVTLQAYRVQFTPYGRQLARVATALSHEGGEYRLFHLNPGYYYVSASYSSRALQPWKSLLELSPNLSNPDDGNSTIYYPANLKLADAKVINLNSGGLANADIGFRETKYFRLKINVILPLPLPPPIPALQNPRVALFPAGTDLGNALDYVVKGSGPTSIVERLSEGDYVMVVLADFLDSTGNGYSGVVSDTQLVHVTENTEARIVALNPMDVAGNIVRPTSSPLPANMQVQIVRVDPLASQNISADVSPSGDFKLLDVGPGTYDVFLQGMPRNAYIEEARFPNADRRLLQIRIDESLPARSWISTADGSSVRLVSNAAVSVTLNPNGSSIGGNVVDGQGRKFPAAQVVLVPSDPVVRLRKDRYGVTYSDSTGAFQLQGIPSGTYMAYAFEEIESDIYFDPDFNSQVLPLARSVFVGGGLNRPIDRALTIITKEDVARVTR